ncbi:NAD-dependent epimerase/dehydratase family protein [Endozoicomonas lisbonensis]|uniref:Nucleoside-diphosphate-sugar epimerase n=1 Tax=Endozoicomonas lisbonensis TaxID=3120522 RepID=A0ABV2SLK0_9GAMM
MTKKTICITGHKGSIGQVLTTGLKEEYELILIDLPDTNILDYERFKNKLKDQNIDAIIHLAWNCKVENFSSKKADPNNLIMANNVYEVALNLNIPKVIMASSVHTHDVYKIINKELNLVIDLNTKPNPVSPYGESKIQLEKTGKKISKKGLQVICIRFGGVCSQENPWSDTPYLGLSHPDCVDLLDKCIKSNIKNNFLIIYGISDNDKAFHNLKNTINWIPKIKATDFYNISN